MFGKAQDRLLATGRALRADRRKQGNQAIRQLTRDNDSYRESNPDAGDELAQRSNRHTSLFLCALFDMARSLR